MAQNDNKRQGEAPEIIVPYRFIPLSKMVYTPEWAYQVSQDIPFEDEVSGSISYELVNSTDLCVGSKNENKTVIWEKDPVTKRHVIPGTSIKGMLRNVLEIISFGKMEQVENVVHSYRDLGSSSNDYLTKYANFDSKAAFLGRKDGKWQLFYCQSAKIKNSDPLLSARGISNIRDQKVTDKYKKFPLEQSCISAELDEKKVFTSKISTKLELDHKGYVVFTGFRIEKKGVPRERYDYSYFYYDIDKEGTPIDKKLIDNFFLSQNPELLSYLKSNNLSHPENKDIKIGFPIRVIHNKNNKTSPLFLGTVKMSRILAKKSIKDLIETKSSDLCGKNSQKVYDLAEIMFGTIRDEKGFLGLKGRVLFSDLVATQKYAEHVSDKMILGEPKSSFANTYLEWNGKNSPSYTDGSFPIAGRKRYQILTKFHTTPANNKEIKDNVAVRLTTLKKDSIFNGKIVFHNLKPQELGALIWAMQMGAEADNPYCHSLGLGKPYGAGAIRLKINDIKLPSYSKHAYSSMSTENIISEAIKAFESNMETVYSARFNNAEWKNSPQIKLLHFYAKPTDKYVDIFPYNDLDSGEFGKIKSNNKSPNFGEGEAGISFKESNYNKPKNQAFDGFYQAYKDIFDDQKSVDHGLDTIQITSQSMYSISEGKDFENIVLDLNKNFKNKTLNNDTKGKDQNYKIAKEKVNALVDKLLVANVPNNGEHKHLAEAMYSLKIPDTKIEMTNKKKKLYKTIIQCFMDDEKYKQFKEKFGLEQ